MLDHATGPMLLCQNNDGRFDSGVDITIQDSNLTTRDVSSIIDEENNYHKVMVLMIKNIEDAMSKNDI